MKHVGKYIEITFQNLCHHQPPHGNIDQLTWYAYVNIGDEIILDELPDYIGFYKLYKGQTYYQISETNSELDGCTVVQARFSRTE